MRTLATLVLVLGGACAAEVSSLPNGGGGGGGGLAADAAPGTDATASGGGGNEDEGGDSIACYDTSDDGATWYAGPSASDRYDDVFTKGPRLPASFLDVRVPQGLGTWQNWDGSGADLIVFSGYADGNQSWLQGVNPETGAVTKVARVAASHVGGVAIHAPWAYVAGSGNKIDRYALADLEAAFVSGGTAELVPQVRLDAYAVSFLATQGDSLFAGKFNETARDAMVRYTIEADGSLSEAEGPIEVPMKTQGVAVTENHYYFSTSYGRDKRSNIYVVERNYPEHLDGARHHCFRAPSMTEGMTVHDGDVYVVYESGSYEYRDTARNAIPELHRATTASLLDLMP